MSSVLKEFRSVKGFNREIEPSSFHQSEQNIGKYKVYSQGGRFALLHPLGQQNLWFLTNFP